MSSKLKFYIIRFLRIDFFLKKKLTFLAYLLSKVFLAIILLVDDSLDDLLFLEEFLVSMKCECRLANSGKMAIDHLKIEKFDLIISDYQMDHGDGLWLFDQLKNLNIVTPFILVSSEPINGGDAFSQKPIDLKRLEQQIRGFISL